jgi:exodeoxyribonuclease VII small subunit
MPPLFPAEMPKAESAAKPEPTFEAALTQLEKIVEEMDDDALPLEELIVRYAEGTKLVKVCEERLAAVEKKIEIISRTASGEPRLQDFDPSAEAAPPPAKPRASEDDVSLF